MTEEGRGETRIPEKGTAEAEGPVTDVVGEGPTPFVYYGRRDARMGPLTPPRVPPLDHFDDGVPVTGEGTEGSLGDRVQTTKSEEKGGVEEVNCSRVLLSPRSASTSTHTDISVHRYLSKDKCRFLYFCVSEIH